MNDNFMMPLILQKHLGHPEIKNAKHWKISNECYMCDKWKYTLIFWDVKGSGKKFQIRDPELEEMFEQLILQSEVYQGLKKDKKLISERGRAYISGSFTGWEPRRML